MAGRKYTYEEAKAELDKWKLGQTSEKYESGNRGLGTISSLELFPQETEIMVENRMEGIK